MRSVSVLSLLILTACTAWHATPLRPHAGVVSYANPVQVQLHDGRTLLLRDVRITRDTLTGIPSRGRADTMRVPQRIPTRDITLLRVREPSPQRNIALTAALLFVGTLTFTFSLLGGGA